MLGDASPLSILSFEQVFLVIASRLSMMVQKRTGKSLHYMTLHRIDAAELQSHKRDVNATARLSKLILPVIQNWRHRYQCKLTRKIC